MAPRVSRASRSEPLTLRGHALETRDAAGAEGTTCKAERVGGASRWLAYLRLHHAYDSPWTVRYGVDPIRNRRQPPPPWWLTTAALVVDHHHPGG
jgi:hypothetical protein